MSPHDQQGLQIHIPQEIYDLIIDQTKVDCNTLYNLCLVSRSFLPQARRTLYHDINISDDSFALCSGWLITATRALRLFRTLAQHNPFLAKYVRNLYHRLASHDYDRSGSKLYWTQFKQTLRLMVNLKSFIITCINPEADLYAGCTFRLDVFASDKACDEPAVYQSTLEHLAMQPNLKSLYAWRLFRHGEHFPDTYCLDLEALTGDRRTIEDILPGRSITRLTWIPDSGEDISSPPNSLSAEFSKLCVLSLGGYYKRPSLRLVLPYLPSLEVLRLFGESRELDLFDEFELVPELSSLRIFIWTAGFATSVKWINFGDFGDKEGEEIQYDLVKDWFNRSKVLEAAYFHIQVPTHEPQFYVRWNRQHVEEGPKIVGYEEAIDSHNVVSWYS